MLLFLVIDRHFYSLSVDGQKVVASASINSCLGKEQVYPYLNVQKLGQSFRHFRRKPTLRGGNAVPRCSFLAFLRTIIFEEKEKVDDFNVAQIKT